MSNRSGYDGLQHHIRQMETPEIDIWKNEYDDRDYTIDITNLEFTTICPKTGHPDFASIRITYVPDKCCVELKSLKEYFLSYRDVGIFHEHLVNKVMDDFVAACKPRRVEGEGDFNVRGGLKTVVRVRHG